MFRRHEHPYDSGRVKIRDRAKVAVRVSVRLKVRVKG